LGGDQPFTEYHCGMCLEDVEVAKLAGEETLAGGVKAYSLDEAHAR
jgi:hypothetical protein